MPPAPATSAPLPPPPGDASTGVSASAPAGSPADRRALCLRACAALLAAGYAPDQFVVELEGRRYVVAAPGTAPRPRDARERPLAAR